MTVKGYIDRIDRIDKLISKLSDQPNLLSTDSNTTFINVEMSTKDLSILISYLVDYKESIGNLPVDDGKDY